jgi:hypothetical protein
MRLSKLVGEIAESSTIAFKNEIFISDKKWSEIGCKPFHPPEMY